MNSLTCKSTEQIAQEQADKLEAFKSDPEKTKQLQDAADAKTKEFDAENVETEENARNAVDAKDASSDLGGDFAQENLVVIEMHPEVVGIIVGGVLIGALIIGAGTLFLYKYNKNNSRDKQWEKVSMDQEQQISLYKTIEEENVDKFTETAAQYIDSNQYLYPEQSHSHHHPQQKFQDHLGHNAQDMILMEAD